MVLDFLDFLDFFFSRFSVNMLRENHDADASAAAAAIFLVEKRAIVLFSP